ncbi:hypothetical protein NEOKW01_0474 [Nematocida sp. AWRm80]|nr:hypothetical protein NEOKW01_0474 [Nematocida sp. AWRm80]
MKFFSLLLLQCKKSSCRMVSHLLPKKCSLICTPQEPTKKNLDLMDRFIPVICGMDNKTNSYTLLSILESLLNSSKVSEECPMPNIPVLTADTLSEISNSNSILLALGPERTKDLFNLLFNTEVVDGVLVCSEKGEEYPVVNRIVDFVNAEDL